MSGQKSYLSGGVFYGLFLAAKIRNCLIIDKYGIIQERKTLKGFKDSKRLLDCSQNFKMTKG